MNKKKLKNSFLEFCKKNKFEKNIDQLKIIESMNRFLFPKKNLLHLFKKIEKKCFYLYGDVGSGKTMLINFVLTKLNLKKCKIHFNEFMINFHDFRHKNKKKKFDNFLFKKFEEKI